MEHDKLFRRTFSQFLLHQFQKFVVRRIIGGTDRIFFYKIVRIGFHSEEVNKRMVVTLVGEKGCPETCLFKGSDDSLLMIDRIVVAGGSVRHQHGDTFMCRIRLCQYFRESNQTRLPG